MERTEMIDVERICTEETQTRDGLREQAVEEYSKLLLDGEDLGPLVVFVDGEKMRLAAGAHRLEAHKRLGHTQVPCVVRQGDRWAAIEFGIHDNLGHLGERLTRKDKRHAVAVVLKERPEMSDSAIGDLCHVSDKTVATVRRGLETRSEIPSLKHRVGTDGKTYPKLGGRPAKPADESEQPVAEPSQAGPGEFCSCGGRWESMGDGTRACLTCGALHPDNPKTKEDEPEPQTDLAAGEDDWLSALPRFGPPSKPSEDLFDQLIHNLGYTKKAADECGEAHPGPDYHKLMKLLNQCDTAIERWQVEEGLEVHSGERRRRFRPKRRSRP